MRVKTSVRERDGYACTECGMTNEEHVSVTGCSLDVHRLIPGSEYTIEGCVSLCRGCHAGKPKREPGQRLIDEPWRAKTGAKQLGVQVTDDVKQLLTLRAKAERRTIRSVLECVILHYVQTVPVDGIGTALDNAVPTPKRGRPKKDAGEK